ncbi:dTDP-4-dehydrorhamnose 3,5-epimerase [Bacillus sp. N1-1]|uniref:dTDP-4-dehydrorhamnose 3,5-epimerase n=1 Tax=Bacillus sp. N1-1 TaxID=2682541 RepID=UPI001317C5FF|nr:dTDP-4-dehydrorhamnose 3,5-epimerase [Bacillus sp. N1-1]QHA93703.1 dTDP-4-dehydrorhamnose 3,5-epimerase [Bacillus sp. N1-1]
MKKIETKLAGLVIIEPIQHKDPRGFFMESYQKKNYEQLGIDCSFVQDNQSLSKDIGVIRGLHYQKEPYAQSKLVRVLSGAIFDVAVDLRPDSPTYGEWEGVLLSEENNRQLFVPKGFAHGFCTLKPHTQVFYKVDQYYSKEHDSGIRWNDPQIGIEWPVLDPILSHKDRLHPYFDSIQIYQK